MAKSGGVFKLDAICDKLKTNLKTKQITNYSNDSIKDMQPNGLQVHVTDHVDKDEPNNNTGAIHVLKEINISLTNHNCHALENSHDVTRNNDSTSAMKDHEHCEKSEPAESRKNRRKSRNPRNISILAVEQTKDDLADYEVNNPGVDFSTICEAAMEDDDDDDDGAGGSCNREWDDNLQIDSRDESAVQSDSDISQLSCEAVNRSSNVCDESACEQNGLCGDGATEADCGILDLSMAHHNAVAAYTQDNTTEVCVDEKQCDDERLEENGVLNLSLASRNIPSQLVAVKSECALNSSSEEVEMKDYAENTMNELLSMYGLADDGTTDAAGIHLKNFDSETFFRKRHQNNIDVSRDRLLFDEPSTKKIKVESSEANDKMNHSTDKSVSERFITSGCYIKSCLINDLQPDNQSDLSVSPSNQSALPDYQKYLKRFNSYEECHGNHCEDMAYKEHFHCLDCSFRVFVKKEEMIRHFKWHKKRDESLQHGFMRYSPMDDCSKKFPGNCTHNGKQTHYHCLQAGCSKVYISTSDVQMHANYHRKDSAILQEGFQRFRATEDCATPSCSFYNQRTTHFHCRRLGCTFTFKNKADMEKHKTYHQKDEILTKDGFKKFMKYEHCSFVGCRYSKTSNHIHCIRPGCHYVLHSTGQLYSHKRRHERAQYDNAYRRFKISPNKTQSLAVSHQNRLPISTMAMIQTNPIKKEAVDVSDFQRVSHSTKVNALEKPSTTTSNMSPHSQKTSVTPLATKPDHSEPGIPSSAAIKMEKVDACLEHKVPPSTIAKLVSKLNSHPLNDSLTLPIPGQSDGAVNSSLTPSQVGIATSPSPGSILSGTHAIGVRTASPTTAVGPGGFVPKVSPPVNEKKERDESWKKFLTRYTANDPCHSRCQFLYKDHYHCNTVNCGMLFRSKDRVREHAKLHEQQERITSLTFMVYEENVSCSDDCQYNHKEKHYHCLWADCKHVISAASDPVFSRMEHYKLHEYSRASQGRRPSGSCPIIGTPPSLKRRRGRPPKYQRKEITQVPKIEMTDEQIMAQAQLHGPDHCISNGFKKFTPSDPCPDDKCIFAMKEHYHCIRQRCHHATDNTDLLSLHAKDFHSYIHILEGFEFFDRTVNCRRPHCHNNKATRHFHCIRPNCDYSFVRVSTMAQHDKKHRMIEMGLTCSRTVTMPTMALLSDKLIPLMPVPVTHPQQMVSIAPGNLVRAGNTYFSTTTTSNAGGLSSGLVQVTQTAPIMVAMPPRHPQSTQGTTTANIQPIIIAPITTALQGGSVTHAGSVVSTSTTAPLLIKPPAISTELLTVTGELPVMTNTIMKPGDNNVAFTSQLITIAPKPVTNGRMVNTDGQIPATVTNSQTGLTVLLQQKLPKLMPQTSWANLLVKMHCSPNQNCGRPFCKLKKKEHFHCFDCNQAFSDPLRLKTHVTKHGFHVDKADMIQGRVMPLSDQLSNVPSEDVGESSSDGEENSSSLNLVPGAFSNLLSKGIDQDSIDNEPGAGIAMDLSVSANRSASPPQRSVITQEPKPAAVVDLLAATQTGPDSSRGELLESLGLVKRPGEATRHDTTVRRSSRKHTSTKQEKLVKTEMDAVKTNSVENQQLKKASCKVHLSDPAAECKHPSTTNAAITTGDNQSVQDNQLVPSSIPPTNSPTPINHQPNSNTGVNNGVGYRQYKYNEDCQFDRCAYRQSQSHYHCSQNNCGYAFCDLSRFTQHSERHRRLLDLMGDEFEEYRASIDCARADCEFSKKSAHFHCLKCPFICTEAVKVTAHRKTHTKLTDVSH